METNMEIAKGILVDIVRCSDVARGYCSWSDSAEAAVNTAFQIARENRRSVVSMGYDILEASKMMGSQRFTECMTMAVDATIDFWYRRGWLKPSEERRIQKILQKQPT